MKNSLKLAFVCMMSLITVGFAWASGSYSSFAVGQTIYSKNVNYYDYFPVIGSPPSTGPLQSVSWSYSFSSMPSGMVVLLCQTGIGCINVTSSARGTTTAFNTAGGHPNGQFYLNYAVNGTGTMSPVYSNNNNVIVNW